MTDHSSPEQNEFYKNGFTQEHWEATRKQAEQAGTPRFLALRGYEFSRNNDPETGEGRARPHERPERGPLVQRLRQGPHLRMALRSPGRRHPGGDVVLAQFNHPQMPGPVRAKNFNNYQGRTRERNEVVRLAEIGTPASR